jgi:tetratricopeptide (TPR) repeat protein
LNSDTYQKAIEQNTQDDNWIQSCEDLKWCYDNLAKQKPESYASALDYFRRVIEQYPSRWIAWHECGFTAWKAGNLGEAIRYYHEAIKRNVDDSWGWSCEDLRLCYEEAGLRQEAYEYFLKLSQEHPGRWSAWHSRALLEWHYKSKIDDAVESYQQAIAAHPKGGWFWSWQDMGWCLNELGQFQEAYKAHQQASAIESKNWHAWRGLGRAAEHLGQWDEAIGYYRKAIQYNPPGSVGSWNGLGNCYRGMSQLFNAWEAYQTAIRIDPEAREAMIAVEELGNEPWIELHVLLSNRLDIEEVRNVCFYVGVDFDGLGGEGKAAKIRELIQYCQRNEKVAKLLQQLRRIRSDLV